MLNEYDLYLFLEPDVEWVQDGTRTYGEDNIRRRSIVSKLVECTSRKRKDTELFIVEGDSAKGPFLFTRNQELQAVLPLRGKILNITNKSVKEAVKNSEICDIANAMGCGIGTACDASKNMALTGLNIGK